MSRVTRYETPTLQAPRERASLEQLKAAWHAHLDVCSECEGYDRCERGRSIEARVLDAQQLKLPGFGR